MANNKYDELNVNSGQTAGGCRCVQAASEAGYEGIILLYCQLPDCRAWWKYSADIPVRYHALPNVQTV